MLISDATKYFVVHKNFQLKLYVVQSFIDILSIGVFMIVKSTV